MMGKVLTSTETPASQYVDLKVEEIEENEIVAENLPEVPGKDDVTADVIGDAHIKADGTLQPRKKTISNLPYPVDPEQLRKRIRVMGRGSEFAKLEVPNAEILKGF